MNELEMGWYQILHSPTSYLSVFFCLPRMSPCTLIMPLVCLGRGDKCVIYCSVHFCLWICPLESCPWVNVDLRLNNVPYHNFIIQNSWHGVLVLWASLASLYFWQLLRDAGWYNDIVLCLSKERAHVSKAFKNIHGFILKTFLFKSPSEPHSLILNPSSRWRLVEK